MSFMSAALRWAFGYEDDLFEPDPRVVHQRHLLMRQIEAGGLMLKPVNIDNLRVKKAYKKIPRRMTKKKK